MFDLDMKLGLIDEILADLVQDKHCDPESYSYNAVYTANKELWKLSDGKDVNYSVPGIGRLYSSWYHIRRIRTSYFGFELAVKKSRTFSGSDETTIKSVIDLGCGTGSAAWALALLGWKIDHYVGVDSSKPMLKWADLLWQHRQAENSPRKNFKPKWINLDFIDALKSESIELESCDLLILSHLLDYRSSRRLKENTRLLSKIISFLNPRAVICSSTSAKMKSVGELMKDICGFRPKYRYGLPSGGQYQRNMHKARLKLFKDLGVTFKGGLPYDFTGGTDCQFMISHRIF